MGFFNLVHYIVLILYYFISFYTLLKLLIMTLVVLLYQRAESHSHLYFVQFVSFCLHHIWTPLEGKYMLYSGSNFSVLIKKTSQQGLMIYGDESRQLDWSLQLSPEHFFMGFWYPVPKLHLTLLNLTLLKLYIYLQLANLHITWQFIVSNT